MFTKLKKSLQVPETWFHALVQFTLLGIGTGAALFAFQEAFFNIFSVVFISSVVIAGVLFDSARDWAHALLWSALIVFGLVRPFGIEAFYIPSSSMEDTLHVNDHILVNKLAYYYDNPERWEIAVFRPPHEPDRKYIKRIVGLPGDTLVIRPNQTLTVNDRTYEHPTIEEHYSIRIAKERNHTVKYSGQNAKAFSKYKIRIPEPGDTIPVKHLTPFEERIYTAFLRHQTNEEVKLRKGGLYRGGEPITSIGIDKKLYFVLGDHRTNSQDSRYWGFLPAENLIGRPLLLYWPPSRARLFL